MGRSAPKPLSSLSLGPERKCKCYNGYLSMNMFSILKNTGMEERHTTTVSVSRDRPVVSFKLTTMVD